jgi:hypothetical protein
MAVQVLKARGVPEEHILFLNLIASPEGVKNFSAKFPRLRVVTAFIDEVRHLACLHRCRPLTNRLSPGPRREELYRSWTGRLWRQILYHLRAESWWRSYIISSRERKEWTFRVKDVANLGIVTGCVKETFNNHHLRIGRRSPLRPLFGCLVQILLEMCHRSRAPRCLPWRQHRPRQPIRHKRQPQRIDS